MVLISGTGTLLQALIDAAPGTRLRRAGGGRRLGPTRRGRAGPGRGGRASRPSSRPWPTTRAGPTGTAALTKEVAAYAPDLVVSAGFLKLVGPDFLSAFGGRTINTHPALLPSFPGIHGPRDALAYGVKISGATVFLVDAGVDTGVILAQAAVPVAEDDTVDTLHERIKVAERDLLVDITHRLATRRWRVEDRKVTWE